MKPLITIQKISAIILQDSNLDVAAKAEVK